MIDEAMLTAFKLPYLKIITDNNIKNKELAEQCYDFAVHSGHSNLPDKELFVNKLTYVSEFCSVFVDRMTDRVIGFILALPLTDDAIMRLLECKIDTKGLKPSDIKRASESGLYNLLIDTAVFDKEYLPQKIHKRLFAILMNAFRYYAENKNRYCGYILLNQADDCEKEIADILGLSFLKKHDSGKSSIYGGLFDHKRHSDLYKYENLEQAYTSEAATKALAEAQDLASTINRYLNSGNLSEIVKNLEKDTSFNEVCTLLDKANIIRELEPSSEIAWNDGQTAQNWYWYSFEEMQVGSRKITALIESCYIRFLDGKTDSSHVGLTIHKNQWLGAYDDLTEDDIIEDLDAYLEKLQKTEGTVIIAGENERYGDYSTFVQIPRTVLYKAKYGMYKNILKFNFVQLENKCAQTYRELMCDFWQDKCVVINKDGQEIPLDKKSGYNLFQYMEFDKGNLSFAAAKTLESAKEAYEIWKKRFKKYDMEVLYKPGFNFPHWPRDYLRVFCKDFHIDESYANKSVMQKYCNFLQNEVTPDIYRWIEKTGAPYKMCLSLNVNFKSETKIFVPSWLNKTAFIDLKTREDIILNLEKYEKAGFLENHKARYTINIEDIEKALEIFNAIGADFDNEARERWITYLYSGCNSIVDLAGSPTQDFKKCINHNTNLFNKDPHAFNQWIGPNGGAGGGLQFKDNTKAE
ncbi:MAG: hypothetical protein FWH03_07500 [Firmicutes bacterium]|nr:hypothetical protein [Bacillota bacterium]